MTNSAAETAALDETKRRILDAVLRFKDCRDDRPLIYTMRPDDPLTVGDIRNICNAFQPRPSVTALRAAAGGPHQSAPALPPCDMGSCDCDIGMCTHRPNCRIAPPPPAPAAVERDSGARKTAEELAEQCFDYSGEGASYPSVLAAIEEALATPTPAPDAVRAQTIEECAKVAETWFGNTIGKVSFGPSPQDAIAAAIRSLSPATGEG